MRTGRTKSLIFTPLPATVDEQREAAVARTEAVPHARASAIADFGQMIVDVEIITGELKSLPFEADLVGSKLRVIRNAATRLADRASGLLGGEK